jgi:DNA uptake protein ComE-like DNA-binding protein
MYLKHSLRTLLHRRATILVVVLWVMIGLACVTLYFSDDMRLEYKAADNSLQMAQARQAIDGMRRYLFDFFSDYTDRGILPVVDTDYEAEDVQIGDGRVWLIGRTPYKDKVGKELYFGLIDEASKINLNTATLAMLQKIPNMTDKMAARIIDWRDSDDTASDNGNGAETQTYQLGTPSYRCKNGDFETLEELRYVIGPDDDMSILYNEDTNNNGILDDNEDDGDTSWPSDNTDGKLDTGIMEYLTLYSREPNKAADGTTCVNITETTSTQKLQQLLTSKISQSRSTAIMAKVGSLRNMKSLLQFYKASGMTAEEFAKVDTYLSTTDDDFMEGHINVNTASADVLACVPGLDSTVATTLVTTREGLSTDKLNSIAWVTTVLTQTQITQAGPYLTAHSYVYTADMAAVGQYGRGFQRDTMVIDTADTIPKVVYHRDRTRMGWPLGKDLREQLDTEAGENKK